MRWRCIKMAMAALSLLMAVACANWNHCNGLLTKRPSPLYTDGQQLLEIRAEDLLSRMTLAEKIGQMTMIDRSVASPIIVQNLGIGGVLNGGSEPRDSIEYFQDAALSTRLQIPLLEALQGHNKAHGATIFPQNIGLGATRDPELVKSIGIATALEARAIGIQYVLAPCLAVCEDPRWENCHESYSEDPQLVRRMTDVILGLQGTPPVGYPNGYPYVAGGTNVVACAKHFVRIEKEDLNVGYQEIYQIHVRPYLEALTKGLSTIMVSGSTLNGSNMHADYDLLTGILKEQMGFQGFILSDWQGIDRITNPPRSNYTYSVLASINAGVDMVMVPFDYRFFIHKVTTLVTQGHIPMSRIDDAVRRILRVKFIAGLFENPKPDPSLNRLVGNKIHRQLAREAVRKSLVLLKNGHSQSNPMLPLSKNASKILVAGSHANNLGYQYGRNTIPYQKTMNAHITTGTTILQGIQAAVNNKTTQVVYVENPDPIMMGEKGYSYGIVVVGEAEGNNNLTISAEGIEVVQNVCSALRCVVILISGRPLVVEPYLEVMDAVVAAWLPGSEGGHGVSDVIFGDNEFEGRLPVTWLRRVEQLPMNLGDVGYDPLFPIAFGLSMNLQS